MATQKKPKLRDGELYKAILTFFGASGVLVQAGDEYRGDSAVVRLHPMHFALSADGQPGLDAASAALRADIDSARQAREERWYGPKQPEPQPARVVAVKGFPHRGVEVAVGSVWLANHEVVASAPDAFVPVQD